MAHWVDHELSAPRQGGARCGGRSGTNADECGMDSHVCFVSLADDMPRLEAAVASDVL